MDDEFSEKLVGKIVRDECQDIYRLELLRAIAVIDDCLANLPVGAADLLEATKRWERALKAL
jgi:hypothetical protein